jgi:excisionase family DNA binding protein
MKQTACPTRKPRKPLQTASSVWLTVTDVAALLQVCRQTVYSYLRAGLPSKKIRGIRRIHRDELERWLAQF